MTGAPVVIPCLGATVDQVWKAWKADPGDFNGRGWRDTFGLDIDQQLEFFHGVDGKLQVAIAQPGCTPLCREATNAEVEMLLRSIRLGRVQIYRRGRCDSHADRRADCLELHRATGRTLADEDAR